MPVPDQPPGPLEGFQPLNPAPAPEPPSEVADSPVVRWDRGRLAQTIVDHDLPPPPIIVWGAPIRAEDATPSATPGPRLPALGGWTGFRPGPRVFPERVDEKLELWQPGPGADPPSVPYFVISVIVALLTGAGALLVGDSSPTRNTYQAILTLLFSGTVLQAAVTTIWQEYTYRRKMGERAQRYRRHLDTLRAKLTALRSRQRALSIALNPAPGECLERVAKRDAHLWERSLRDDDFLETRLGLGGVCPRFSIVRGGTQPSWQHDDPLQAEADTVVSDFERPLEDAPVTASLAQLGYLGIAGEPTRLQRVVRAILIQLATHHSPHELKLFLSVPDAEQNLWSWTRDLPHAWNLHAPRSYVFASRTDARNDLQLIADQLRVKHRDNPVETRRVPPSTVFVFADPDLVSEMTEPSQSSILELILAQGTRLGAYAMFVAVEQQQFPSWCDDWVELAPGMARLHRAGPGTPTTFIPDEVDLDEAIRFGQSVARLRT